MSKGKITVTSGVFTDSKGNQVTSLLEALRTESKCGYGIDWCDNSLHLPVIDITNGTTYDAKHQFVLVGGTLKLRTTYTDANGNVITKEVNFS